jgi:hypothetical protein
MAVLAVGTQKRESEAHTTTPMPPSELLELGRSAAPPENIIGTRYFGGNAQGRWCGNAMCLTTTQLPKIKATDRVQVQPFFDGVFVS